MDPEMEYLQKSVNPILEPLVIDLLIHRPENPAEFIHDWIEKNCGVGKKSVSESKIVDNISQTIVAVGATTNVEKTNPAKKTTAVLF